MNSTDSSPNLSASGLGHDVWIGLDGTGISGYTLSSSGANATNYRIVPISGTTQTATVFTGAGNNLIVSASAVPTDANSSATGLFGATLTINGPQDYSGATTITGVVRNTLMGGGVQRTTVALVNNGGTSFGDLSGTSGVVVNYGAGLTVAGNAANYGRISSPGITITVKGGATLTDGDTNATVNNDSVTDRINNTDTLALGGDTGGGTFTFAAAATTTHSQTFAALSIGAGASTIAANTNTGTNELTFTSAGGAGYHRSVGGLVTINPQTGFVPAFGSAADGAIEQRRGDVGADRDRRSVWD